MCSHETDVKKNKYRQIGIVYIKRRKEMYASEVKYFIYALV